MRVVRPDSTPPRHRNRPKCRTCWRGTRSDSEVCGYCSGTLIGERPAGQPSVEQVAARVAAEEGALRAAGHSPNTLNCYTAERVLRAAGLV